MKGNKFIPLSKPLFGNAEKKAVIKAMDSGWVTLGPKTHDFEENFQEYIGTKHAVAVSSATAGLHIAYAAAGIGPGDEIIAPVFTFAATINPAIQLGAKPVLVDVFKDTYCIDPDEVAKKITKKTKAIIPVHYGGQACDMDRILEIARKNNLLVIEDAAHANGTEYKGRKIGTLGDMTIFSFHPIKNMTTGDGGMVTTNNEEYDRILRLMRLHGMNKEAWKRLDKTGNWYYEITLPGYKYNMTDIASVIGIEQLKKLDRFNKVRQKYAQIYNQEFQNNGHITPPVVKSYGLHVYNLYAPLLHIEKLNISRNDFIEELKKYDIGSSVYFMPLHFHPYYRETYGFKKGDYPHAEWIYERLICLPMCPALTVGEVKYVARTVKMLLQKYAKT